MSNLLAMLMAVILLVLALSLFASVHDISLGEAALPDLLAFSADGWSGFTILCASFGIGVVLINIFITGVGKSYEQMHKTNMGSFLDRRNSACQKAILLRENLLSYIARCEEYLWTPEEGGVLCLRGLVTPLQAVLLYQHLALCFVLFFSAALGCLALRVDLGPLLLVICLTVIMMYGRGAVIVCHTELQGKPKVEKPEGQRSEFWWIPDCYVWVAKATVPRTID